MVLRILFFTILLFSSTANAVISGPSTDADGTYDLTWNNSCGNGADFYNLYENGQLILGQTCQQSISITSKPPAIYDYVLEQCGSAVIEGVPETICCDVDTHTVTVGDGGGGGGGGVGGGGGGGGCC